MSKQIINKLEIISEVFPCINGAVDGDMFEVACVGCINQGVVHDNSCNCKAQAIIIEFELRKKEFFRTRTKSRRFAFEGWRCNCSRCDGGHHIGQKHTEIPLSLL